MELTQKRKLEHLDLCLNSGSEFEEKTSLLEEVNFIHNSLPELEVNDLDLSTTWLGKKLNYPIIIAAMTGGTDRSEVLNQDLARLAEKYKIAIGLGSQRAMVEDIATTSTFCIRDTAPSIPILGNIGIQQARRMKTQEIRRLISEISADALALHLNPTMELIQTEGERNFREGYTTIQRLVSELDLEVVIKETGAGISYAVAKRLLDLGVRWIDISGAGGCSWTGIESLRAQGRAREIGKLFKEWGIPTAASLYALKDINLSLIATGGIRTGLDIAKSLALGAKLVGAALPFLRAYYSKGYEGIEEYILYLIEGLKVAMMLTGSRTIEDLRSQKLFIGKNLKEWRDILTAYNDDKRKDQV